MPILDYTNAAEVEAANTTIADAATEAGSINASIEQIIAPVLAKFAVDDVNCAQLAFAASTVYMAVNSLYERGAARDVGDVSRVPEGQSL